MWLLSTRRAELKHFNDAVSVRGGYAILSHTWGANEQTFQDLMRLRQQCEETGENPRDRAPEKIRMSCILALQQGYQWMWIDTCCINKESSAELSEAINSMFHWYSCAEVCYAYLDDIPEGALDAPHSSFRNARWHKRGWTLQELIAPSLVVFVSKNWKVLGTKLELAGLLDEITGISAKVLTHEVHYTTQSVAYRMSWASYRETTRVEDEAYCLMGLFGVNMPTIYGEGRRAFQRLQLEIMKQTFDTSLFSWGHYAMPADTLTPLSIAEMALYSKTPSLQNDIYPLAHAPKRFSRPFDGRIVEFSLAMDNPLQSLSLPWQSKPETVRLSLQKRKKRGAFGNRIEIPTFTHTSYGIECRFPIIEYNGVTVAVLFCEAGDFHVGLLLHQPSPLPIHNPKRSIFNVGYGFTGIPGVAGPALLRIIPLGKDYHNLRFGGKKVKATWRDICIQGGDSQRLVHDRRDPASRLSRLNCFDPKPPFYFPNWRLGLLAALGMEMTELRIQSRPEAGTPMLASLEFEDVPNQEAIHIHLGTCTKRLEHGLSPVNHCQWATASVYHKGNWSEARPDSEDPHDCLKHHIGAWPNMVKRFGDDNRMVTLCFLNYDVTCGNTLLVEVELGGTVYKEKIDRIDVTSKNQRNNTE
ncbi:heterokaryon incompatibility protein-domain-containing protein [Earliella scabrosa]|nr:heterokaryon incompatibility protein-domain-containing protein [Earliella scabrosa]